MPGTSGAAKERVSSFGPVACRVAETAAPDRLTSTFARGGSTGSLKERTRAGTAGPAEFAAGADATRRAWASAAGPATVSRAANTAPPVHRFPILPLPFPVRPEKLRVRRGHRRTRSSPALPDSLVGGHLLGSILLRRREEDGRIGRAIDLEDADEAPHRPRQGMVDQHVVAGDLDLELDHRRATRRDGDRLDVGERRRGQRAEGIGTVEDLADDVEGRSGVRTAIAEEDADGLADLGGERVLLGDAADRAVEDEIFRPLVHQLVDALGELALRAEGLLGIDLALHDVEFVIDLGEAALRLDQDQPVH